MSQNQGEAEREFHLPVLAQEVVELLRPTLPGVVIDATFGGGGHSKRMLDEFGEDVRLIGIDRDPAAAARASALGVTVVEGNFADLSDIAAEHAGDDLAGVLFDFGVSSHQLDTPQRGFSYHSDGPLDMRMGTDTSTTADEIVNNWPVAELSRVIRRYGEEPLANRYARAIVAARPITGTAALASVIAEATPAAKRGGGHPARRTFQAIRIAVNAELTSIEEGLEGAIEALRPGGRVVAISYHSLEDRIVKRRFVAGSKGCTCPPELPVCGCGNSAELRLVARKPIRASDAEVEANPRARSALMRAAEKVAA